NDHGIHGPSLGTPKRMRRARGRHPPPPAGPPFRGRSQPLYAPRIFVKSHDAWLTPLHVSSFGYAPGHCRSRLSDQKVSRAIERSEEHTSELQSHSDLVCRLLLEKK